ncbi:MAG: tetratricopeptide repeat protein [Acidobacteria bacterium]|nr:tetratricopeptide repeat protein [Acidobacteriota bacterium]MBV9068801.1 tetratricopeptide repeat protein [Acidobacteriota bacterium]MBV9187321.1 tetratricopeptide repeat protein [Acidobacteriota bacterium]
MKSARSVTIGLAVLLAATAVFASWYDDYDDGVKAVRNGQWSTVISKMTAAINGNAKENDKARTYGAIFINYHPYYYRGIAYLNTGKYEQAISDLEKASGPGEENLGSIETLMSRAKGKLTQASTPPPPEPQPPAPQPRVVPAPVPVPVQPAAPSIDPALRQRANAEINQAKTRLAAAMQRKAGNTPQYGQATQALTDALTKIGNARSNDDLNAAIASAQNAATIADLAPAPGAPAPPPTVIATRPAQASSLVLADPAKRIRGALESYFNGDFEDASKKFGALTGEMPKNAYLWAFLGASQYSQYAFEADDNFKDQAMQSFRKAKSLRKWNGGLPPKYFSRRIRKVFDSAS